MNKLHEKLLSTSSRYASWHKYKHHEIVHLLVLAMVIVWVGFLFLSNSVTNAGFPNIEVEANITNANSDLSPRQTDTSKLTRDLLNLANQLNHVSVSDRSVLLKQLTATALVRKEAVLVAMNSNPLEVLNNALGLKLAQHFPSDIQSLLEEKVTLKGKFQAFHIDNIDGSFRYEFSLTDEVTGKRYQLHFANDEYPNALTDDRVQIHGVRVDGEIALATGSTSITTLAATSPTVVPNTFGSQKTLVMLINFSNNATQPYTVTSAQSVMNTTSNFDKENSFNQAWLTGVVDTTQPADVTNWMTIAAATDGTCAYSTWASQAKSAAIAAGYNLANYNRYVYAFPSTDTGCSWWGLGSVGGNPSSAWVNGSFALRVVGHEMGHNFGLYHSHSLACASGTCTTSEYGDGYDIMGGSSNHFNAFQKSRLGWLNYNISPPITLVSSNGTYALAPYESNDLQPKALQILKSSGTTNTYYYVEYRAGLGFDSGKTAVIVHSGTPSTANSSNIWDLDQVTTISDWVLNVGQTYQDTAAGISITALSQDSTSANIGVAFGPILCTQVSPSIVITPTSQSGTSGQTLGYNYTLTNNDSSNCSSSTFGTASSLPSGWFITPGSFLDETITPGTSVTKSFNVTSSDTAVANNYSFSLTATNVVNTSLKATSTATYTVIVPDTTPPTVVITKPANGSKVPSKGNLQISATASDSSGIASMNIIFDGNTIKTCTAITSCSIKMSVKNISSGTHTITVNAIDNSPNANLGSAAISVFK